MEPILKLKNVSYTYQNKYQTVPAVRDVSASFSEGQIYAIIGKSGSGKSTLLSLLAGLALPTDGHIYYRGKSTDSFDLDQFRRENVAVIYQSFNLFPLMTSLENVCYPLELRGMSPKQAAEIAAEYIKKVDLPESVHRRFPNMLSGGEQQRVAIARALASGARVILADEPTGNLDVLNGELVVGLLSDLGHQDNYTVIIVTHDVSIVKSVDVVFQMSDGRISEPSNDKLIGVANYQ